MAKAKQPVKAAKAVVKKKKKIAPAKILVHVKASYNNTLVTTTTYEGEVLSSASCGSIGFKGSKKSTAYASTKAGEEAAVRAMEMGAKEAEVMVKGIGIGRQAAIKGIRSAGMRITLLSDITPVPHGGCKSRRQPKK